MTKTELEKEVADLRAQVAELRAALKPFADQATRFHEPDSPIAKAAEVYRRTGEGDNG